MTTTSTSSFTAPLNAWLVDGVRTPMVDYCGPLGHVSPTDMGIKVARAVLERSGVPAADAAKHFGMFHRLDALRHDLDAE